MRSVVWVLLWFRCFGVAFRVVLCVLAVFEVDFRGRVEN